MKRWVPALVLLAAATTAVVVPLAWRGTRSVRPVAEPPRSPSAGFDRRQSAALFVGVRDFASVEPVPFAVDDAVDLAYLFALHPRVRLVPPRRVVLVLSGTKPVKPESREHLRALREAGADVRERADAADVLAALHEQTALAGRDGMLIVSIAAHGLLRDGNSYVLGSSSRIYDPTTMLSTAEIFDTIAASAAQRSVVFVDACRDRMVKGRRAVLSSAMGGAPLARRLAHARGQVVFYAAAAGESAYDDFQAQNGVFTKAVIGGVQCGAAKVRGAVTTETLARYVETNVRSWIRENRDPNVGSATQVNMDGDARNMPLATCGPLVLGPARAAAAGTTVRAFLPENELLWQRDAGRAVVRAEAIDLDADGWREVVFGTSDAVVALDDKGNRLWT
ncbi:MAG TPA: caspase family protein, partial [Thermoanaerobaculia bacterium]|nr:caspase family protein [Thermoanaerobaculia bacterium]